MNRLIPIYLIMYFLRMCGDVEKLKPTKVCDLPVEINESSGLEVFSNNLFATHNDSGGDPIIYFIDSSGTIVDTVHLSVENKDWEGMAIGDDQLFIGDFGNNSGKRTDLRIFALELKNEKLRGEILNTYEFAYPGLNHDAEALYYSGDTLFVVSKVYPQSNSPTEIFALPLAANPDTIHPYYSLEADGPITGADFYNNRLALLSYGYIMILELQTSASPFTKKLFQIPVKQTEAIAWLDEHTLFYTSEGGSLYRVVLPENKNPDK